ncbi:ALK and LTK ligand 2 isoform X2 [Heterocephalus glaber]|uniref:ALK and LTK ligand 2 isoform X2 n=1 Tax=Heterocephalus glaber TaxID=10181 RepID=A0AAX6S4B2_HETGA|nr:ALK and LTK ligand 2 isoform X2 [Heterocephalus glaber]
MRAPGRPLLLGLLLVLGTAGPGRGRTQPRGSADRRALLRLLLAELAQELRKSHPNEAKRLQLLGQQDLALGRREAADYGADPEEQRVGPLYFSPKCSKHFHRLYHNTRDCTIPAYYKRCARLLTRLAVSPMCMEG